ncbi:hypothetical protein HK405_000296, partial [Cladochytrium tenue]
AFPPPPPGVLPPSATSPAALPAAAHPFRSPASMGPLLRFGGMLAPSRSSSGRGGWLWTGSVLVSAPVGTPTPTLVLFDPPENDASAAAAPVLVDSYGGWSYYRFELVLATGAATRAVEYAVTGSTVAADKRFQFFVPGSGEDASAAFWTCNGFGEDMDLGKVANEFHGIQPLWKDLLRRHKEKPFH